MQHTLYDRFGWGQDVEAYSILLPSDWSVSGKVAWGGAPNAPTCMAVDPQLIMSAHSPDGLWGFEIMPAPAVSYMAMSRFAPNPLPFDTGDLGVREANETLARQWHIPRSFCRVTPNITIEGLVEEALLSNLRPNSRVLSREPLPELREQLQRTLDRQTPIPNMQEEALAFLYTITFDTPNGPVVEELAIFASNTLTNNPSYDGTSLQQAMMTAQPVFALRYPPGRKSEADPLMMVIVNSLRSNPRWDAAMARHNAEMNQIAVRGAEDRSKIWAETSRAVSDIQMEGWRTRVESSDRMIALSSDQIREVTPVKDPATGQEFELPNTYSTFYRNPQGEFLMSADPNFRASELFPHENWTRLEDNPR